MDNKMSNKRKSVVTTNVIPIKSRKIVNTTASSITNNNKSSKSTDKLSEKQIIKNKTAYKSQKISQEQKPGDKCITFEEDKKPEKIEEINGNNSLSNSNNEEIDEADLGRYLAVKEDGSSDEELEIDEKDTFDEQTKVNEANLYDEFKDNVEAKELNEKNPNEVINNKFKVENFSVRIIGIKHEKDIAELFQDCKIMYFDVFRNFNNKKLGHAFVYFEDKKSLEKAFKKNGTIFNGKVIEMERLIKSSTKLTVDVSGLHPIAQVEYIFNDCEIEYYKRNPRDKSKAVVHFKNEESVAKALSKNEITVSNCVLTVKKYEEPEVMPSTEVKISGYKSNVNVRDIFNDCNIITTRWVDRRLRKKGKYVIFADKESFEKALLKDKTEHDGCLIKVFRRDCMVALKGAITESQLKDIFNDCNIKSYSVNYNSRKILIFFNDIESAKKAVKKDRTEYCGRIILVEQNNRCPYSEKLFTPKKQCVLKQEPCEKSFAAKEQNKNQKQLLLMQMQSQILTLEKEIFEKKKTIKKHITNKKSFKRK